MTPYEICKNYRDSKNKREQIMILAELNCTDQATIKMILRDGGLELPRGPLKGQAYRKGSAEKPKAEKKKKVEPKPEPIQEVVEVAAEPEPVKEEPKNEEPKKAILLGMIEGICNDMCNNYCKYPLIWNDAVLGDLCDSEVCKNCPLNNLV